MIPTLFCGQNRLIVFRPHHNNLHSVTQNRVPKTIATTMKRKINSKILPLFAALLSLSLPLFGQEVSTDFSNYASEEEIIVTFSDGPGAMRHGGKSNYVFGDGRAKLLDPNMIPCDESACWWSAPRSPH